MRTLYFVSIDLRLNAMFKSAGETERQAEKSDK